MTKLAERKTRLLFTTESLVRSRGKLRQVVIEAQPRLAIVRLHGTRMRYVVTWDAIHDFAARIAAEQVRKDKATARKAKKGGKR